MTGKADKVNKALLPAGLRDTLPPDAEHEAAVVETLIAAFRSHGYDRVKPPLVEFEEGLLEESHGAVEGQTFRLMDPVSQRMMGVRADITPQVARIATTRLVNEPRPLRLCYSGEVLRVRGSQLRPVRQFCQVGVEMIGAAEAAPADAEVVLLAAQSLRAIGIENISIDLNLPTLVPALMKELGVRKRERKRLRTALDRKDAAAVEAADDALGSGGRFGALMAAAGPAGKTLETLTGLDLPGKAARAAGRLERVMRHVLEADPDLRLTADPVEHRGFEYQTGVAFSIFGGGVRGEIGSGGRYTAIPADSASFGNGLDAKGEAATGFTLFMDTILRALDAPPKPDRAYAPLGTPRADLAAARAGGFIVQSGLVPADDPEAEAKRLKCTHLLKAGKMKAL